jgi:hypothetical protein
MTPTEQASIQQQLEQRRAEFQARITAREEELAAARTQAAAAEADHSTAVAKVCELEALAARGVLPGQDMAGVLYAELQEYRRDQLKPTRLRRAQARSSVESLTAELNDLRLGVAQINRSLERERPRHVAEVVKRPAAEVASPYRLVARA